MLALHEGSVVGIATGYATVTGRPALVNLHTTAGLGNAVGALATARVNRVPLVVVVGQQDRRHLALRPFLAGELDGLAGDYPVWVQPARPRRRTCRARSPGPGTRRTTRRGPALVIVPSDDWAAPADDAAIAAPAVLRRGTAVDAATLDELPPCWPSARHPALVVGRRRRRPRRPGPRWSPWPNGSQAPVWQESFAARAGFPQDHPLFAGHLPAGRARLREALAGHDVVLAVGAPVFRQYPYEQGPLVDPGTTVVLVTDDLEDAHHSPVQLAVVAGPAGGVRRPRASGCPARERTAPPGRASRRRRPPPRAFRAAARRARDGGAGRSGSRPTRWSSRRPRPAGPTCTGCCPPAPRWASSAPRWAGWASACRPRSASGWRRRAARSSRWSGDGSSLYGIQALWSAAHYGCGVLFVVLANGRYAVMDRLAEQHGTGKAPWPAFEEVSISALAKGLGCPATARRDPRRPAQGARRGRADPGRPHRAAGARGRGRSGDHVRSLIAVT